MTMAMLSTTEAQTIVNLIGGDQVAPQLADQADVAWRVFDLLRCCSAHATLHKISTDEEVLSKLLAMLAIEPHGVAVTRFCAHIAGELAQTEPKELSSFLASADNTKFLTELCCAHIDEKEVSTMIDNCMRASTHEGTQWGLLGFLRRMHSSIVQDAMCLKSIASTYFLCRAETTNLFRPLDRDQRPPWEDTLRVISSTLTGADALPPKLIESAAELCAQRVGREMRGLSDEVLVHAERLIAAHKHTHDPACCLAVINLLSLRLQDVVLSHKRVHLPATLMWLSKMVVDCSKDTYGLGSSEVHKKSVELLLDVCEGNNEKVWTLEEVQQCVAFKATEWQRWQRNPVGRADGNQLQNLQKLYYYVPFGTSARAAAPPRLESTPAPPRLESTPVAQSRPSAHVHVATTGGAARPPEYTGRGSVSAVVDQVASPRPHHSPPKQRPAPPPKQEEPGVVMQTLSQIGRAAKNLFSW